MTTIKAADLFCGAGGSSTGLKRVADALGVRVDLTAVNHWPLAVETHAANHPDARHVCESLDSIDPRKVTGGSLDLLWASPECTHHSRELSMTERTVREAIDELARAGQVQRFVAVPNGSGRSTYLYRRTPPRRAAWRPW